MSPINGCNPNKPTYFSLEEYVDKIELNDNIRYHIEETSEEFDKYIKILTSFDESTILYFLISAFEKEMKDSNLIENHIINPKEINEKNVFFDSLTISHKRIKDLHQFVTDNKVEYDYRKDEVRVSYLDKKTMQETIYWYGVYEEDIKKFMDDFIKIYKNKSMSAKDNNAFIKSAIVHLLLTRIHPFVDGNGRTARIIQNMKFTEAINKVYGYNLKISPLHLSQSICLNQPTYCKRLNNIYFDLEHDSNEEINNWLDFILNMYDEQIYCMSRLLQEKNELLNKISINKDIEIKTLSKKMHLKK